MNRRITVWPAVAAAVGAALTAGLLLRGAVARPGAAATEPAEPRRIVVEGRLTSLNDEFARIHKADRSTRVKEPMYGIKAVDGWYVLLHTRDSERFWLDKRMRDRDLIISGRLFPGSKVIEVSDVRRRLDGKVYDVFYWCELCAIKAVTDDPCVCCQGEVELRERPAAE